MERIIILKNTDTGEALTLPVTPASYPMGAGRAVERLDMAQTGQIALPGLKALFTGTLEFELPAIAYSYMTAGAVAEPQHYISLLTAWSRDANVCRYIVTGTEVNLPVLLGPLEYGESDGTNNVQCKLPLYEYRYLDEVQVEKVTQNSGRQVETPPQAAGSYTVVKGDSLWAICKKFYGDGSLAYKLATANNIKNPNLIYPGQVLTLPGKSVLAGYAATPAPASPKTSRSSGTAKTSGSSTPPASSSVDKSYKMGKKSMVTPAELLAQQREAIGLKSIQGPAKGAALGVLLWLKKST